MGVFKSQNFRRLAGSFMTLLLVWGTCGCSIFRSSTESVSFMATPADAVLIINGQTAKSPATLNLKRNSDINIQCMKEGYYPYSNTIGYSLNTTGVLDVIGLCFLLVPGIGLLTPGAWSFDQTSVVINLVPMTQQPQTQAAK